MLFYTLPPGKCEKQVLYQKDTRQVSACKPKSHGSNVERRIVRLRKRKEVKENFFQWKQDKKKLRKVIKEKVTNMITR